MSSSAPAEGADTQVLAARVGCLVFATAHWQAGMSHSMPTMFFQAIKAGDINARLESMLASVIKTSSYLTR